MKRLSVLVSLLLLIGMQAGASTYQAKQSALEAYEKGERQIHELHAQGEGTIEGYAKAAKQFEVAIELDPNFVDAYLGLARVYWNMSQFYPRSDSEGAVFQEKGMMLYRKALAIDPTRADIHVELSNRVEDQNERIASLTKAIELEPDNPEAHGVLARILLLQGKIDQAFEEYLTHLKVSPYRGRQDGMDHLVFGKSLAKKGRKQEAVAIYKKILALGQTSRRFERCFVFLTLDLRPYAEYEDFVTSVQKLRPYCTNFGHEDRGRQLSAQGKIDEAIEEYKLQLKVNPYYSNTYFLLETIYRSRNEPAKARQVLKQYFDTEEDPVVLCQRLERMGGRKYQRLGKEVAEKLDQRCASKKK